MKEEEYEAWLRMGESLIELEEEDVSWLEPKKEARSLMVKLKESRLKKDLPGSQEDEGNEDKDRDKVTSKEDLAEGVGFMGATPGQEDEIRNDGEVREDEEVGVINEGDRVKGKVISKEDLVEGVTVSQSVREVRKDGLLLSIEDEIMKDDEVRDDGNVGVI